jgi:hypothetical protein
MKCLKSVKFIMAKFSSEVILCQFTLNHGTLGSVFMSIHLQSHVRQLDKELSNYFDCIFCVDVVLVLQYVSNPLKLCGCTRRE